MTFDPRNQYLTQIWTPYPIFLKGVRGRIINIQNHLAVLHNQTSMDLRELQFSESADIFPEQVLREGDIICAQNKICYLLSPNLHKQNNSSQLVTAYLQWAEFKQKLRHYFQSKQFIEMETPYLVDCPGTEPFLDPLELQIKVANQKFKKYLPTSPELHLKKCLAFDFERIFEIKTCFRDAEVSDQHQIEFSMLEWYRAYEPLESIQKDIVDLVKYFRPTAPGSQFIHKTIADLFLENLGFELLPTTTVEELAKLAGQLGLKYDFSFDFDDLFGLIFVDQIEPKLKSYPYLFLSGYPPSQAALARLNQVGWGERFEFYMEGIEIANAFHELNDPKIQRQRSVIDNLHKQRVGKPPVPLDENFFQALEGGIAPSSGVALGIERLFMSLFGYKRLSDFRLFPIE